MRIYSRNTLTAFWAAYPDTEQPLRTWHSETKFALWKNAADVVNAFPYVSVLKNNRFCFNVRGGNYRLIVHINFRFHAVYVRFLDTHDKYDKIDANTI